MLVQLALSGILYIHHTAVIVFQVLKKKECFLTSFRKDKCNIQESLVPDAFTAHRNSLKVKEVEA